MGLHIARFTPAAPLPGRSYWAIYDNAVPPIPAVIFSLGDGDVIVEQPLSAADALVLHQWLADAARALGWTQFTLVAAYLVQPPAPPPAPKKRKPRRRKPRSVARFLAGR